MKITTVLVDFGGVIADEGFYDGLREIGRRNGHDPDGFFRTVEHVIGSTGYLTGSTSESIFWQAVREATGIAEDDGTMRKEILRRFVLRPSLLAWVDRLRSSGLRVAMLSDQTNWLEEIDAATGLFRHFDRIFNSYRIGKSKRDASIFTDVCAAIGADPDSVLFVDDNPGHIERATSKGLRTILFTGIAEFETRIRALAGLP